MSDFIAAFPMYDWPEVRGEVDACWARLRDALCAQGIDAPQKLVRSDRDVWLATEGNRRDEQASSPLNSDAFDLHALWRHPKLLFAQTCWGPMEQGLSDHVQVVGQPDYSRYEGGEGETYSSAIVMRRDMLPPDVGVGGVAAPSDGSALLPIDWLRGRRFTFNGPDSMSGILALSRDLEGMGESIAIFGSSRESGGHRASIIAVAKGEADVCAIDCRSWALARRFEPSARDVAVVGWTGRRKGLPYITANATPEPIVAALRKVLADLG